ncbi:ribosomal protein S18-alanine N-acetyltransferase [Alkalicoccus chagannorensis]|uniref:ribosomal protein S18-alanine N-acetyltransferase n=1 Tax=Alkalicoccus chagannorensis TaxID=427072 RepID=UPI00047D04F7|nr:ribosomal protein S18-alanine N-acetyltransferase [Alkalicoccus chagannorensis]
METDAVTIRMMRTDDLDGVMDVEHASFSTAWTREAFYQELIKNRFAHYFIAETTERIIGYCGLWVIHGDSHITNIAVHPDYRRRGVGEGLLEAVMGMAVTLAADTLSLEVRVSNEAAQKMYRKFGFENGGIRRGYYTDNQEDALVMWVKL